MLTTMISIPSKLDAFLFVGRKLKSTAINYVAPTTKSFLSLAWSNSSWPVVGCYAVAAWLLGM
jgi:hypothetical protein